MGDETHVLELIPAYALDVLDEDEAALVSEHVAECLECQAELRAYQETAGQLALAVPDAVPQPDVKRRLMERVKPPVEAAPARPRVSRWSVSTRMTSAWGMAGVLLILGLAAASVLLWQRVNRLKNSLEPGGMRAFPLTGTEAAPAAAGFVLVSANGRNGALVVDGLAQLDEEQQYQLWLIQDGQRVSGAVFSVDEGGYGGTRISAPQSLLEYGSAGITIEPAGGSPGPTGDKVLGGDLFGS